MEKPNIPRPHYEERLRPYVGNRNAKVLVGIRRAGKSTICEMMAEQYGRDCNVISFNMELWANRPLREAAKLYAEIKARLAADRPNLLFIDEVQEVAEWESVIRSLIAEGGCDIYLTGSNSRLLAGEFATYLNGRINRIDVFTLTFAECLSFARAFGGPTDEREALTRYLRCGGFPGIWCNIYRESQALAEVADITDAIIKRDIADRHAVRNPEVLDRILNYLCDNLGNVTSVNNICATLLADNKGLGRGTVYEYVSFLEEACLVIRVPAYDIKGKQQLTSKYKYFLADLGIKNARLGYRPADIAGYMENVLYLELRSRGYAVWVGDNGGAEIDLMGERDGKRIYLQATAALSGPEVVAREFGHLKGIADNFPKYVVTLDDGPLNADQDGIVCCSLPAFLRRTDY